MAATTKTAPKSLSGHPLQAYYHYERDKAKRPIETQCVLTDGEYIGFGLAVCSPSDNPWKAIGRKIAYKRAIKQYFTARIKVSHTSGLIAKFLIHYWARNGVPAGCEAVAERIIIEDRKKLTINL